MKEIQAYPLAWPDGWKRTPSHLRTRARFSKGERQYSSQPGGSSWVRQRELTVNDSVLRVLGELQRFGVLEGDAIISTNLVRRLDGLPRSGQAMPADPGVAVYWERPGEKGGMKCMATDRYDRVQDNLAAIAATLEAMRAIERHGGAQILERAFTGFTALPAPGQITVPWRQILGIDASAKVTPAQLEQRYRTLRSAHHPDKGGSAETFHAVQVAYEQATHDIAP